MKELTIEELKQMAGQPVWCPEEEAYGIVMFEYVDPETGVHYLLLVRKDGYGGMGGITPRLDKSGQVMIDKEE